MFTIAPQPTMPKAGAKLSMRSCRLALPLVAALLGGTSLASAATFNYTTYSVTNQQYISISSPHVVNAEAGQIVLSGGSGGSGLANPLATWCLDIYDTLAGSGTFTTGSTLTPGSSYGSSIPALSATAVGEIGGLMVYGAAHIGDASSGYTNPVTHTLINGTNISAAIQIAIWSVEYAGFAYNPPDPNSDAAQLANYYLGTGNPGSNPNVFLLVPNDPSNNQYLGYVGQGGQQAGVVPLPAAFPLFATGLGALGLLGWRRKRKAAAIAA